MYVNIDELNKSVGLLNKSVIYLRGLRQSLKSAASKIPINDEEAGNIKSKIDKMEIVAANEAEFISGRSNGLHYETQALEGADIDNVNISKSIKDQDTQSGNIYGRNPGTQTTTVAYVPQSQDTEMKDTSIKSEGKDTDNIKEDTGKTKKNDISKAEDIKDTNDINKDIGKAEEKKDIEAQVTAVIEILSDGETQFDDKQIETITKAIENINNTKILDGLDKDLSNQIIAQIVKDYMDGKIQDLDKMTKEDLEKYIKSNPEINKNYQLAEVIKQLESLIDSGVLTKEQITSIMNNNVNLHSDDEEFMNVYIKAGGTEKDISKIRYFYDEENKIIHMRSDAISSEISYVIISKLDDMIVVDPKTGKRIYYKDVNNE